MRTFFHRLRQLFCSHEAHVADIVIVCGDYGRYATVRCRKCGKKVSAEYGLALPVKFVSGK